MKRRMQNDSLNTLYVICKTATCFCYMYSHDQAQHRTINKKNYNTLQ